MIVVAGIDVSKATLDVSVSEGPVRRYTARVENSRRGIRSLLKHIVTRAVCESTGGYERLLVSRLKATVIGVQGHAATRPDMHRYCLAGSPSRGP